MQSSEDRPGNEWNGAVPFTPQMRRAASRHTDRFPGTARTAPRGPFSSIGDDETHRRLQEARNRARHSTEDMIRMELRPEWARLD
ncbi:hypothetical protein BH23GEM10_BH23GEM10_13120 [soil metagenome]